MRILLLFLFNFIVLTSSTKADINKKNIRDKINFSADNEKVTLLIELANSYTFVSKDTAISLFNEAIRLAQQLENIDLLGKTYFEFGYLLFRISKMDSALICLKKAFQYKKQQGDSLSIGIIYNRIGNVYWFLGEQALAKENFERALQIHKYLKNDKEIGRTYNNLANLYNNWGDYQRAIKFFMESSNYYKKADYKEGLAWLNFSITLLYKKIDDYENALLSINTALNLYSQLAASQKDSNGIMICYGQLGDIYRLIGKYDRGLQYHKKALRMRQKTGIVPAIADGLMGMGQIYYEKGEYNKSIGYMNQSIKLREESKINSGIATNLKYLGYAYHKLGRNEVALKHLRNGLKMAAKLNHLVSQKDILEKIGQIYTENGKYEIALKYYNQYDIIKDSLYQSEIDKQLSILKLQNQINEKEEKNEKLELANKIQILEIKQARLIRNLLYFTIIVAIVFISVIFYYYKKKIKDNILLKNKNDEIRNAYQLLEQEINERIEIEKEKEKLIYDLKESLSKIKTLKGMIPICSNCKKIRNDKGFYEKLEMYITEHTDAQFSHGICPDCAKELYPNFINKNIK